MPNTKSKSQEPRPKQKRGRKRRNIRDDEEDPIPETSDHDAESSVLMSTSNIQASKKKKWTPLTSDARKHIQSLLNAALLSSYSAAPNQKPAPEVQHALNDVVRRIDRKLHRTLVPVSTKEKTFDREQLTSQNAALQVAVMSEVEENMILQQQIETELNELQREEEELQRLRQKNRNAARSSDLFDVGEASQGRDDRIHDYAQALIKINQTSKPSLHMAAQAEDDYVSDEDGPLERIRMSISGRLQDVDNQTAYMDDAAAQVMETGHKMDALFRSRGQAAQNADSEDDFN
ncbi:hypothetical protein INT43_002103 [Umbelopsis isabellina]|uniref:Uncharacterized protein n=1 Tax=Mortierella isabellina TaxID=91625 RepID=A0A8H7PS89_MORIS|nr:hypothetical protein INT43_002103 [Umbelopsis isabellina]